MLWERGDFLITSDQNRVDIDALHAMLSQTYWANWKSLLNCLAINPMLIFLPS